MKARTLNRLIAVFAGVALCGNAACEECGWALAGSCFGWLLIVTGLYIIIDTKLKERENL